MKRLKIFPASVQWFGHIADGLHQTSVLRSWLLVIHAAEPVEAVQKHVVVAEERQLVEPLNELRVLDALAGSLYAVVHRVLPPMEARGSWP